MRITLVLSLFVLAFVGCSKDESMPPVLSSEGLVMNGSHYVPVSGTPDEFSETKPVGALLAGAHWSTPPVARISGGYAVGATNGKVYLFNSQDSLERQIDLGVTSAIDQLMIDSSDLYVIAADRRIADIDLSNQTKPVRWSAALDTGLTGAAILCEGELLLPTTSGVMALQKSSGSILWRSTSSGEATSLAYSSTKHCVYAALTGDDFAGTDTIIQFAMDGKRLRAIPIKGRITSNIALCGKDEERIAAASASGTGDRKNIWVQLYDAPSGKKLHEHSLPYFANSIGANRKSYITSGFRTTGGESVSGIDAFSIDDTNTRWSRRFTEPVLSPVAVSNGNVYFSLTFESDAIVNSKGLFYALDAGNGKTVLERAVMGAVTGFVPGMPMPDEAGRLMLADRVRPVIYLFNRSAFRRVF